MGPQEKRLTRELAVYLVRSCSLALRDLPPGANLKPETRRRWFERAYREWQLTPRVDLVGRSPYEVIAAERAAEARNNQSSLPTTPTLELYTDLPALDGAVPPASPTDHEPPRQQIAPSSESRHEHGQINHGVGTGATGGDQRAGWQHLANRLFGSWLDEDLERL